MFRAALSLGVPPLFRTRVALLASILVACLMLGGVTDAGEVPAPSDAAAADIGSTNITSVKPGLGDDSPIAVAAGDPVAGGAIEAIHVEGNQRIEESTIRSYMLVQPGDPFDPDRLDRSLKTLYATGLFSDVSLRRDGATLVVKVVENPIVNRIAFEGNHKLKDETLRPELQLKARAVFTPALAQADRQRILDLYARRGRYAATVDPKIIKLDQNRVDVVFEIHEGDETLVSRIAVIGNHAFSEDRLKEVIGSREEAWWRFLSSSDSYDPDRVNFDKELLRRFYLHNGYADFEVVNATAELAPDRTAFFLTFTVNEGERYKVSKVTVNSTLRKLDGAVLQPLVDISPDDWYDGDAIERNVQTLTDAVQARGYAFVDVKPRISRDRAKHLVDLVFDVGEGPRVYIERIDIVGNTRTKDKVIRREFRLAEGDAFNAALIRRSRQRLQDLGYFNGVTINTSPGSAPDRSVVTANIDEKATGELTLGGGYSTDIGALANIGVRERNLIGTGIDASVNTVIAQLETSIDLSLTDPYFLDRNIVTGLDLFDTNNNNQTVSQYNESRMGFTVRAGYDFSDHLRQSWAYSLVNRKVNDVATGASIYIDDLAGTSSLSQLGQTLTIDYRDSTVDPRSGWLLRGGTDFAGLGGTERFIRTKVDGVYYIPLESLVGDPDWGVSISAGSGYLFDLGTQEKLIDNFFLGGDNLRGFEVGGAGPHAIEGGDSLGGRFIWTQSTELRFPLPISPDLGLTGRAFVDVGALSEVNKLPVSVTGSAAASAIADDPSPRVGAGVGVSWKTPFGLINIDVADPVVKKKYDQTQVFRFGFGTRF
jgi:outer membrane protein insertion porin family